MIHDSARFSEFGDFRLEPWLGCDPTSSLCNAPPPPPPSVLAHASSDGGTTLYLTSRQRWDEPRQTSSPRLRLDPGPSDGRSARAELALERYPMSRPAPSASPHRIVARSTTGLHHATSSLCLAIVGRRVEGEVEGEYEDPNDFESGPWGDTICTPLSFCTVANRS